MAQRRRSTPKAGKATRTGPGPVVTIRTRDDHKGEAVPRSAPIDRMASEWSYILRSRARWLDDQYERESLRVRALEDLKSVGVSKAFMQTLASTDLVEVELHAWDEADEEATRIHEAAAEVPWEYLLSVGSRAVGRYHPILICRLFQNGRHGGGTAPGNALFIESAPGRLADAYDFDLERDRIRAALGADGRGAGRGGASRVMEISASERFGQLADRLRRERWDVLHVTGVDTHQASWLIEPREPFDTWYDEIKDTPALWDRIAEDGRIRDGMMLREANVPELPVSYGDLARALVDPDNPPSLVTLNLYYSGARTAREIVRQGAHAAIGFLDEIDDEVAERFFQAFYWALCRPGDPCEMPDAFTSAWEAMSSSRLHGTGIVFWTGHSIFESRRRPARPAVRATRAVRARKSGPALASLPVRKLLQVQLEVPSEVNYSLLHNDRPLLDRLTITKLVDEPLEDITVQVELNLGSQNYPYRCTHLLLDEPQLSLAPLVRVPLTAALPRSLQERVQSSVYVKVTCGGRTALETTERVTLIPVDEWLDDTTNNPWLPSFVLPRDPAILKIINSARRYLIGIADDPAAGFDGYQSVDPEARNPTRGVDDQVRALWTAIVNDYRLQYINPPPAYSPRNQRLRTPTDILASNTGTCIDLTLLLASCLEYIDIYPVLVLLEGHAFPGYWRSEEAHDAFVGIEQVPAAVPSPGSRVASSAGMPLVSQYGWRLTRLQYDEIMEFVTSGDLVMLEATFLTSATSFADAVKEGRVNMRSRREFDSLLDIRLARAADPPVTPLPIINE